jgi:RNA polymerase sigma-70 factor (ECF subfamily)
MYRMAAAIVGPALAEDVTQDALVDAWRGFARLRERQRVRPWLHAIVVNRASKALRSARSRPRLIAVDVDGSARATTGDETHRVAERDRLDRAFATLAADQRVSVALRYSMDLSVPQIAATLGIAEGTVKSRIHAGIQRMRAAIGEDDR